MDNLENLPCFDAFPVNQGTLADASVSYRLHTMIYKFERENHR